MSSFDPKAIRGALCERGVLLNPPVTAEALARLTCWAGAPLHPDLLELLGEFDGFSDGDFETASFVSVWSIDKAMADSWTKHPMLAFSDWSLNAIIFGFDPVAGGSIVSIEDGRHVAPSYRD